MAGIFNTSPLVSAPPGGPRQAWPDATTLNPVTYLMEALRSLILDDLDWEKILPGFAVVAALGVVALLLNVRMIKNYD